MTDEFVADRTDASACQSQEEYSPTPYEDSSWEVYGDLPEVDQFLPLEIEVLPTTRKYVDPMFSDYGGVSADAIPKRWHLPEELAYQAPLSHEEQIEESIPRVSLTEEELENLQRQAYEQGKQEGFEDAVQTNVDRLSMAEERISQILTDLQAQISERLLYVEKQAVGLSVEIAEKIIRTAVEINPEYIMEIVQDAIGLTGTAVIRSIKVSPEDLEFIQLIGFDRALKEDDSGWDFVGDPTIKAGCVVETSAGEVDYQIDPAFERVRERMVRITRS